jgi:hypothetical protein
MIIDPSLAEKANLLKLIKTRQQYLHRRADSKRRRGFYEDANYLDKEIRSFDEKVIRWISRIFEDRTTRTEALEIIGMSARRLALLGPVKTHT